MARDSKSTILVVDDDLATRRLESLILKRAGYEVTEAEDGRHAAESMRESPVDVVVSDILMPVMDGLELLRTLKGSPATESVPVILCSSVSEQASVHEALQLGISGYILKPIVARQLLQKVSAAEKHVVPVLEDPSYTMHKLGLDVSEFQELLFIMIEDGKKRLKEIGTQLEVGDFDEFEAFSKSLGASAANFGALALSRVVEQAQVAIPAADIAKRGNYMLNLRAQMERLQQEVIELK